MRARVVLHATGFDFGEDNPEGGLIYPGTRAGWPEGWPVPRVGDAVHLYETARGAVFVVRAVEWMPEGAGWHPVAGPPHVLVELAAVHPDDELLSDPEEGR